MHIQCIDFCRRVREVFPQAFLSGKVLEVGAYNVNGSARDLFAPACEYVGVDNREGPGVTQVCDAAKLPFPDGHFDAAFSTETFEHASQWELMLEEMARVTKKGGLVFATAATDGRGEHGKDEYGGGHYANVFPLRMKAVRVGTLALFEEQYIGMCDVRAAWVR